MNKTSLQQENHSKNGPNLVINFLFQCCYNKRNNKTQTTSSMEGCDRYNNKRLPRVVALGDRVPINDLDR